MRVRGTVRGPEAFPAMVLLIAYLLFGSIEVTQSTAPLRLLPLAHISSVPVPLAVALHVVPLRRLRPAPARRHGRLPDARPEVPPPSSRHSGPEDRS